MTKKGDTEYTKKTLRTTEENKLSEPQCLLSGSQCNIKNCYLCYLFHFNHGVKGATRSFLEEKVTIKNCVKVSGLSSFVYKLLANSYQLIAKRLLLLLLFNSYELQVDKIQVVN